MNSVRAAFHILPSSTGYEVSEEQSREKSCPRTGLVGTASGLCSSVLCTSRKSRDAHHTLFLPRNEKNGLWQENILSLNKNSMGHGLWMHIYGVKEFQFSDFIKQKSQKKKKQKNHKSLWLSFRLTGTLFCLKLKHCQFEKKSTVIYRAPHFNSMVSSFDPW